MAKAKKKPTRRLAKNSKKRENKELDCLPAQNDLEICLYDTNQDMLHELTGADGYRDCLAKLKQKFLWEIQELSGRLALKADVRVYFTIKPED